MRSWSLLASLVFLMAPDSSAQQPMSVLGRIEKLTSPIACAPNATHIVSDTAVLLYSTTVNLDLNPGLPRRIIGINRTVTCPLVEVTALENSSFTLSVCNKPGLGCPVTIDMCPSPTTGQHLLFVSAGSGFAPVSVATGTFLLHPLFLSLGGGPNTAVCESIPLTLAGPASLVGLELWFQAASLPPVGPPQLSTIAHTTILSPGGCTNFQCY